MALLSIENIPGATVSVPAGLTLLAALQLAGFDWLHACGGKGRCTTCRVRVLAGINNLSPLTDAEVRYRTAGYLRPDERLTCQTRLEKGDVSGRVPESTKLPHVRYSD